MERVKKAFMQVKPRDILAPLIFLLMVIPSLIFRLINKIKHRKLWLVAEQGEARDNGYHFYKYVREKHPSDYCFYAINPESAGYKKVGKLGNVIKWGSLKHWLYYMSANLNISSQKSGNPCPIFWYVVQVKLGLYRNRVFLQHGVTHNDSKWIYYDKTKFRYFICGTRKEYDFIRKKFGYPDENLALTGFPRWDALKDISKKQKQKSILIMPTWRNWLGGDRNNIFKVDYFEKTNYFIKWNELLNDKNFINYIEKNNIVVYFYPHINMMQFLDSFKTASNNIKIIPSDQNIQDFFNKCNLMITDYSSVAFDFAFLNKPVIYYQFDQEEFRIRQLKEGFFSYERDGFGPVVKNPMDVVKCVEKFLRGECNFHVERIEEYFGDRKESFSSGLYNFLAGGRKKKKVIQVVNSMNIGGIETFILNLYKNIDRDKFEFVFLTNKLGRYDYQDDIEKMGGRFVRIDTPDSGLGRRFLHMKQLNTVIKREKPDAIHCHTYFDTASVMIIAKHNRVPVRITHSHTAQGFGLRRKVLHDILAWMIRRYSTVLLACGNEAGLALYKKRCFAVLNNGIDLGRFKYDGHIRKTKREKLGFGRNDKIIGHVGRFVEVKNHSFMMEIAKNLIEQGYTDYKFVFVGDGPLRKDIEERIRKNGMQDNIVILGNRDDVSELYNAFDAFVFPSLYEGMPMALIEAQANGLPVIASSSIDPKSKLNDNFEFLNLDDGAEHWANEIINVNKKRQKPSERIEEYSIQKTVARIEEIYES